MPVSHDSFKAIYKRFDRHATVSGIIFGLFAAPAVIIAIRLGFRSMDVLHATSFPRTLIPATLLIVGPVVAAALVMVPAGWVLIALARFCGLVCPGCRRHLL